MNSSKRFLIENRHRFAELQIAISNCYMVLFDPSADDIAYTYTLKYFIDVLSDLLNESPLMPSSWNCDL